MRFYFNSIKKHKYLKNAYKIKKEQISFLKVNYEYRINILNQLVSYSYSSPQLSPYKAPLHINQPCARSGEVHLNCIVTKVTSARMSAAWLAMSPLAALPQTSTGPLTEMRIKLPSHLSWVKLPAVQSVIISGKDSVFCFSLVLQS